MPAHICIGDDNTIVAVSIRGAFDVMYDVATKMFSVACALPSDVAVVDVDEAVAYQLVMQLYAARARATTQPLPHNQVVLDGGSHIAAP